LEGSSDTSHPPHQNLTANRISPKAILALVPNSIRLQILWVVGLENYLLVPGILGPFFPFLPFAATNWPHLEKTKTVFCPFSVLSLINYKFANVTKKTQKKKMGWREVQGVKRKFSASHCGAFINFLSFTLI